MKSIGSKTYEQCAGFIRILPETAIIDTTTIKKVKHLETPLNPLDQTCIHPESYAIAHKFLKYCHCDLDDLGTAAFVETINSCAKRCAELAAQFGTNVATMEIIIKGLGMRKDQDIRSKSEGPLFHNSAQSIDDLYIGIILSGVVRNVTDFGAFVDIGVGREGLIHVTYLKNQTLHVGQRVKVQVLSIEHARNRISLALTKML